MENRKFFTFRGRTYCISNGILYEQVSPGGCLCSTHYPTDALRKKAAQFGFTSTIVEATTSNGIHAYGHQNGQRAVTAKNVRT